MMLRALDPTSDVDPSQRHVVERELFDYAQQLSAYKREHPGDDIWTILTKAEIVSDDGQPTSLSVLELDMFFIILALAGSETTRNAISQGLMALLAHPDQMQALRDDPSLMPSATDEMIRWASPVLYFGRTVTHDVELGGVTIPAGERVVLWYPSGNRDDTVFSDPFRFDVRRSPNPHVSFGGGGPHYCLGANLAKKEVSVLMRLLLDRFPPHRDHGRAGVDGQRRVVERRCFGRPTAGAPLQVVGAPLQVVGVAVEVGRHAVIDRAGRQAELIE